MRRVLQALAEMVRAALRGSRETRLNAQEQDGPREESRPEQEAAEPEFREVSRRRLGPRASSAPGSLVWEQERITFMDGITQTVADETVQWRCSCGGVAGDKERWVTGVCAVCGAVVCEHCEVRCERCGVVVCRRHAVRYKDHTFCPEHRALMYWLVFWRVLE